MATGLAWRWTSIALFASIPVLAGAVAQLPIGFASDRMDRRKVLVGTALAALVADVLFIVLAPESRAVNLALVSLFGAAIFAMYPIIVAHANDHAPPGTSIQVSGGLLLVFGLGSIVGPLIAGIAMSQIGPRGLFATTVVAHIVMIGFTLWRITKRAALTETEKTPFKAAVQARTATPQTAVLAEGIDPFDGTTTRSQPNLAKNPPKPTRTDIIHARGAEAWRRPRRFLTRSIPKKTARARCANVSKRRWTGATPNA